jgi:plastocyanin
MRELVAYAAGLVMLVAGCGGGGDGGSAPGPNPSPLVLAKTASESGDLQTGPASEPLPSQLRIVVTRDGNPQSGVSVAWSTTGGSLDPTAGTTDGSGVAASTWTLGPTAGGQSAQAAVQGANGSPQTFTATATGGAPPPPPPPPPSSIDVRVQNISFTSLRNGTSNPAVDTVAVNGTVTWTWFSTGVTSHSVNSTGTTAFTSSAVLTGNNESYQFKFTAAGTYTYNCAVHGNLMTGRIVVR